MGNGAEDAILVMSARWQTRAFLAAEIGERVARDVVSVPDVDAALGSIKLGALDPAVMVVDAGRRVGPDDVERLLEAKREVPLVLAVSRLRRDAFDALRERCVVTLVRPLRIGTIPRAVVAVLEEQVENG